VTIDLFFVLPRTGCTSPAVSTGRLSEERGLNTSHMEITLATVTLNGFRAFDPDSDFLGDDKLKSQSDDVLR
jgi:hypothetical protein